MKFPVADLEVFLQRGVRAKALTVLEKPASIERMKPDEFLDRIAAAMKAYRNYGENGPNHRTPENIPQNYLQAYDELHEEQYFGVFVLYGLNKRLSRLVVIDLSY